MHPETLFAELDEVTRSPARARTASCWRVETRSASGFPR